MIFATVGSHPTYRFDRLLKALEGVAGEEIVVQYGPGEPPSNAHEAIAFMSFAEMLERMAQASVVVSHAGVGSILCALQVGRVPVVVPREARYGETVDDHQVELARTLSPTGRIVLVEGTDELPGAVAEAGQHGSVSIGDATELLDAIRAELRLPSDAPPAAAGAGL